MFNYLHPGYQIIIVLIVCVLYIILFMFTGYLLANLSSQTEHRQYITNQEYFLTINRLHYLEQAWSITFRILIFITSLLFAVLFNAVAGLGSLLILEIFQFSFRFIH